MKSLPISKESLVAITLILVFFCIGLVDLAKFFGWDEKFWFYKRIPQLYEAIENGNWKATELSPHDLKPGILPSFVAGTGIVFIKNFFPSMSQNMTNILWAGRFSILVFNSILLWWIYVVIREWLSSIKSLYVLSFLALNPVLLGLSRIVNPDDILWSLSFLTLVIFLRYIDDRNVRDLLLSGFFLGLTMLTKIVGVIFYVFIPVALMFYKMFFSRKVSIIRDAIDFGLIILTSMTVFGLFFPKCWVQPYRIVRGTVGVPALLPVYGLIVVSLICIYLAEVMNLKKQISESQLSDLKNYLGLFLDLSIGFLITIALINYYSGFLLFDPNEYFIFESEGGWFLPASFWASIYVTLFTVPVIAIIGFIGYRFSNSSFEANNHNFIFPLILLFLLLYFFGAVYRGDVLWPRYQAMIYPPVLMISALFWYRLNDFNWHYLLLIPGLLLPLWISYPFYYHFSNFLNTNDLVVTPTWGFGGYEVSNFLNEKVKNNEPVVIWSDNPGVIPFFKGKIYRGNPFKNIGKVDYLVLSHQGKRGFQKHRKRFEAGIREPVTFFAAESPLWQYYNKKPLYEICLAGSDKNCMKVVKL